MRGFVLVAVFLAATVTAGPVVSSTSDHYKCAGYCKGGSKLSYETGSSYVYEYTADTVTSLSSISVPGQEESRLHLSATVEIHAASQCDFTMQLSNVRLEDSSPTNALERSPVERLSEFALALERNSLLFAFQDGTIDELCATDGEAPWALNIKRGILSAFQNSMTSFKNDQKVFESDVTGDCETQYRQEYSDETSSLVRKTKNLLACAHRMDHFLSLQSTPYSSISHAQSLPLVKSEHECYQRFSSGLLAIATCEERHMFRPFSNGDNGAVTKVVQNLVHKRTDAEGKPGKAAEAATRTTLLFQHTLKESEASSRAQTIVAALEELEQKTADGIQSDVPQIFSRLVATLRTTSYPTLAKVFSHTRNQHTRKFLLDAMPLVGTADGLTVMTDLYENKEITEAEMDLWLTSLTFIKKPTYTMLLAVSSLMRESVQPRPNAVLAISSMLHGYCQRDATCYDKEAVLVIVSKMEKMLGDGCHVKGRTDMEQKILALKGIGNAGVVSSSLDTITKCYKQADNPMEVRLAAIRAHRRIACSDSRPTALLDTFTDMEEDTEVRIAAYLAIMQCPSPLILNKIKAALDAEEVNQVASFVWTHLTNLQETSSRWKQNIRELISTDSLRNKFKTDARKFSRNYEGSMFFDSLNAGATIESDIIFSPQSYLPRSAMLNLTLDIFGESINVFEVGTRAEGFEDILEDIFGPEGYFPDQSLQQVLKKARGHDENDMENSIDRISTSFKAKSKLAKEPQASVYARVFGNEIHYARYQGLQEMLGGQVQFKNPMELLAKLFGGQEIDFTNSFVFLDASYKIPTIVGLPLAFSANGSATVGLKMTGHLDTRNLWKTGSAEIQGKIVPSAAVRMIGTMSIDAFVTKAGIQTVSTLHTNTLLGGKVTVQDGSVVDIKIEAPREKVDILEVTSQLFVLRRAEQIEMIGVLKEKEEYSDCSSETMSRVTGMKLCSSLSYVNASLHADSPSFPLTGQLALRIQLLKTDTFDAYVLSIQKKREREQNTDIRIFQFDTPNSKISRKVDIYLSFDQDEMAFVGKVLTPFVKLEMDGKIEYVESENAAVSVVLRKNDKDLLKTRVGIVMTLEGHTIKYQPSLELSVPKTINVLLKGNVLYREGAKYSTDFTLVGLTNDPLHFSADVTSEGNIHEIVGLIKSPLIEGSVHANLRQTNSYVSTKIMLEYALRKAAMESVNLSAKIQSNYKGDLYKNSAYGSLKMSAAPQYNVLLGWDLITSENYLEHNARFGLGPTEWQTKQMYRNSVTGTDINFVAVCQFSCPAKNVDYVVDLQYKTTATSLKTHALAQLNAHHRFFTVLNYVFAEPNHELYAEVTSPWYSTSLTGSVLETDLHFETKLTGKHVDNQASTTKNLLLTSIYIDGSSGNYMDRSVTVDLSGELKASLQASLEASVQKGNFWMELNIENSHRYRTDVTYAHDRMHVVEATVQLEDRTYRSKISLLDEDDVKSLEIDMHLSKHLNLIIKSENTDEAQEFALEFFWDKDANPSRRIAVGALLGLTKQKALLEFPGQYILGELETLPTSVNGFLEWAPGQKMALQLEWSVESIGAAATARFTTPFYGLEAQSIMAGYKYTGANLTVDTKLAWQKETLELKLVGGKLRDGPTFGAEIHVSSSVPSIANVYVDLKHTNRPELITGFYIIQYKHQKVLDASWQSQKSATTAEFSYVSPLETMPSISGKFNNTNGALNILLNYGTDGALLIETLSSAGISRTGYVLLTTTFATFEHTSARWSSSMLADNSGSYFIMEADFIHNKNTSSIVLSKSKTQEFIIASGLIKTPFTESLKVDVTHSTERQTLMEVFSVALDGKQIVMVNLAGYFDSLRNLTLRTELTVPSHTMSANFQHRFVDSHFESFAGGSWNEDWFMGSASLECTKKMELLAGMAGSMFVKELKLEIEHNRETDGSYLTRLALPGEIMVSHELLIKDSINWENSIKIKSTGKSGLISNKQSFDYDALEFSHKMLVDLNGSKAAAELDFSLDANLNIVQKAEGSLTTPWTHPIKVFLHVPINETTIQPKLKLQYQDDKEISVESLIFYQSRQSRFDLEIKSPYCKPVTVKAFYDISQPTKAVLVTFRWEDKQMDLKSTVHLENNKAMGVLIATRSDIDGPIVNGQFKYDISNTKDMTGHVMLLFQENKVEVSLSGGLSRESWRAKCNLATPIKKWEELTALFDIDLSQSKRTADLLVARNAESLSLSGTFMMNPRDSVLSLAFTSTVPAVKSFSIYSAVDVKPTSEQNVELICSVNYDTLNAELKGKLQLNEDGLAEVTLSTPVEGFEVLFGQVRFNFEKSSGKSWAIVMKKNELKVQMEGNLMLEEHEAETHVKFTSPFVGLESIAAFLKHSYVYTEATDTLNTVIVLKRNRETVELTSSIVTSDTRLSANVKCQTPVIGFEILQGNLFVNGGTDLKNAEIVLSNKSNKIKVTAVIDTRDMLNFKAQLHTSTPFENAGDILAVVSYDIRENSDASLILEMKGLGNEVKINMEAPKTSEEMKISADIALPLLNITPLKITVDFVNGQSVSVRGDMKGQFVIFNAKLQDYDVIATVLTSFKGYEKTDLKSSLEMDLESSTYFATVDIKSDGANAMISVSTNLDPQTPEVLVTIMTPFANWERLSINGKYDMTDARKTAYFIVTKMAEKYETSVEWFASHSEAEWAAVFTSPILNYETLKLGAYYNLKKDLSAKITLQKNTEKIEGIVLASRNDVRFSLETPWKDFKLFALSGSYQDALGTKKISLTLEKNKEKSHIDLMLKTNKDTTSIVFNSPFNICRTLSVTTSLSGNLPKKVASLSIIKNSLALLELEGEFDLDMKSSLGFNVNLTSPLLPLGYSRISCGGQYKIQGKQNSLEFHFHRDALTVISSVSKILYGKDGEVTFSLSTVFKDVDKSNLVVQYIPDGMSVSSIWTSFKDNKVEYYIASFSLTNISLEVHISSPIKGFEMFDLTYKKSENTMFVDFTTTFLYYDLIKLNGEIDFMGNKENSISLSMRKDQKTISADWKLQLENLFAKSTIDISTPFELFEKCFLSVEYDFYGKNKAAIVSLQRNNYTAKIESILRIQEKLSAEASLNITTSGEHFDNIKFYGSYNLKDSSKTNAVLIGHWNDDWRVNVKFLLESESPGVRKVAMISMTPIPGTTFNITGSYNFATPSKLQHIEALINILDIELNFLSVIEDNWKQGKLEGRFGKKESITEPKITWKLINDIQQKSMNAILDFGEDKKAEIKFDHHSKGLKNVSTSFNFIDFSSQSYHIETYWNVLDSSALSKVRYEWSTEKQIVIESKLNFSPDTVVATIQLSTPFISMKKVNFDGKWSVIEETYELKSALQFDEKRPISLDLLASMSTFFFNLQTPISDPFILSINYIHSDSNISPFSKITSESIKSDVHYGLWEAQVAVNLKFYGKDRTVVEITAKTPLDGIKHLYLEGDVKINEKYAKLVLEKEEKKFGFEMSLPPTDMSKEASLKLTVRTPFEGFEQLQFVTLYDLTSGAKVQIFGHQNQEQVISADLLIISNKFSLDVKTPAQWLRTLTVQAVAILDGPVSQLNFDLNLADKTAKFEASCDKKNDKVTIATIKITSSWSEELVLATIYDRQTNHQVQLDGHYGEKNPVQILGVFNVISEKLKMELEMRSSIDGFGDFTLATGYDWKDQLKKVHMSAAVGDSSVHVRAEGKVGENGINGDLHIDTPLASYKLIEVKVEINKNARAAQTGSLAFRLNSNVYELRYSSAYTANSIDGHLTLSTPHYKIDNAVLNLKHNKNFVFLNMGVDGKTLDFEGSYQLQRQISFVKAKLSVPFFEPLQHLEFAVDRNCEDQLFKFTMQWTQRDQIIFTVNYRLPNFKLRVDTPFDKMRTLELAGTLTRDVFSHNMVGKAVWNEAKIDLDGKMSLQPFDVDVSSQAEWGNGQVAYSRAKFSAADGISSGHIVASIQDKEINLAGEIDTVDMSNIIAKLNIQIPFFDVTPIAVVAQFKKQDDGQEILFQAVLPTAIHKIQANYIYNNANLKIGLDFDLPILKSNFLIGGSLINNGTNEVDGNIYINDNKISASFKLENKVITASFDLNFPFLSISGARVDIQASSELSPDLHSSVTYRFGMYSGSVSSSLLTLNKAFTMRLDLDLPQLLGDLAHTARLSASFPGPHYTAEARYDDGRSTRSSSLEIDTENDLTFVGRITGPVVDTKEVSFLLVKNWSQLRINVIDLVVIEVKHEPMSGSFLADCFGKEHKLVYNIARQNGGVSAFLVMESPALKSKEIKLSVSYKNSNDGMESVINCSSGSSLNQFSVKFNNLLQNKKSVELNIVKSSQDIVNFFASSDSGNDMAENKIYLDYVGSPTFLASLKHRTKWPLDIELHVASAYLPESSMEVKLNVQDRAASMYAGFGSKNVDKFVSLVAKFDPEEKIASVEFLAPRFNAVNVLKFNGVFKIYEETYSMISFNGLFSSNTTSEAQISFGFLLSTVGIDTSLMIITPLADYKSFKAAVQIPFAFSKNCDLNLSINFPSGINYAFEAKFQKEIEQIELGLLVEYGSSKLGADVKVVYDPITALEISLNTPLRSFRNYRIQLRGQKSIRDGDDIINYIEYNDKRIEIRHSTIAKPKKLLYRIQITTPFKGFERYVAGVEYDFNINHHKKALVTLGFPRLVDDWTIEFDFRFNNPRDLSFMTLIQAPIFTGFKVASFMIGNKLDNAGNSYRGVVTGRYNEQELLITVNGIMDASGVKGEVKAQLNQQKLHLQADYKICEQLAVEGLVQIETPFKFIENAQVSGRIAPFDPKMLQTKVVYNSVDIMDASLNIDKQNIKRIQVINPWRPVYVAYSFLNTDDKSIWGEICWDMNKQETSKLGGGFSLFTLPAGRQEFTAMLKLPTRDVSLNGTRQTSSSRMEYSTVFSWDIERTLGFAFKSETPSEMKRSSLVRLDLPFRSFEVSSHAEHASPVHSFYGGQLMWDAAANRTKKAGFNFTKLPNMAELTLQHIALKDDLVLHVEHSDAEYWTSPVIGEPRNFQLFFDYSNQPQDLIEIGIAIFKFTNGSELFFVASHVVSKIDYELNFKTYQSEAESTTDLGINYLDPSGLKRSLRLYGTLSHVKPAIKILAKTSENVLSLNSSLWSKGDGCVGFTVDLAMNQKEPLSIEGRLDANKLNTGLDIGYGSSRKYLLTAGMPTPQHISAGIRHTIYGTPSIDGQFDLRLNTSRHIWTQVMWTHDVLGKMKDALFQEYSDVRLVAENIVVGFVEFADQDFVGQLESVNAAVNGAVAEVGQRSMDEINLVVEDFTEMGQLFGEMYDANEFYLKDIHQLAKTSIAFAQEKASCLAKQVLDVTTAAFTTVKKLALVVADTLSIDLNKLADSFQKLRATAQSAIEATRKMLQDIKVLSKKVRTAIKSSLVAMRDIIVQIDALVDKTFAKVEQLSTQLAAECIQAMYPVMSLVQQLTIMMHHSFVAIAHSINDLVATVYKTIMSVKEIEELVKLYQKYSSWVEEFSIRQYVEEIVEYFTIVRETLVADFHRMFEDYKEYIDAASNAMSSHLEDVNQVPSVVFAKRVMDTVSQKLAWTWQYHEMSEELKWVIHAGLESLNTFIEKLVIDIDSNNEFSSQLESTLVVRPGFIELSQNLPIEWDNFFELPKFSQLVEKSSSTENEIKLDKYRNYISIAANSLTPDFLDNSNFLPPFGSTGLIAGRGHFITFDNRFYEFEGECSYLLASDLIDNTFSVIVNYHTKDGKVNEKSLTILSEGHNIEISAHYRVTVDGVNTELPAAVGNSVVITREGHSILVEKSDKMSVECNLYHDICTVKLSGWYLGKVGGLLGTFDNEPANDMALPNGTRTTDVAEFASEWRVGGKDRCRSTAVVRPTQIDEPSAALCDTYLAHSKSPMSSCFLAIDTEPFLAMCRVDGSAGRGPCDAVIAYGLQCAKAGITIRFPEECVQCSLPNNIDMIGGDSRVVYGSSLSSADIVFVVQQESCVENVNLAKLATKLDATMIQQGLTENRFAVVSFGGETFAPHARTVKGSLWTNSRSIEKVLQSLSQPNSSWRRMEEPIDVYTALQVASRLPFRMGATKTVVLVQCSACSESMDPTLMLGELIEREITLHILQPKAVAVRSAAAVRTKGKVFGADRFGVYTARNVKSIAPSGNLLKEVVLMKDSCSPLALQTNGTVFNSDRLTEARKQLTGAKKFIDVWSRRVARSAKPAECQKCDCVVDKDGVGKIQCQSCVKLSVDQLLVDWESLKAEDYGLPSELQADNSDETF